MMETETPAVVDERVFHEDNVRPGAICRRYVQSDESGEWEAEPWFVVVSEPQQSEYTSSKFVFVVYLTGDDTGVMSKQYLSTLGVKPPHRGVTEKHEFDIPEKYIASSRHARSVIRVINRITR